MRLTWLDHEATRRVAENLVLSLLIIGILLAVALVMPSSRMLVVPAAAAQGLLAGVFALYCALASWRTRGTPV